MSRMTHTWSHMRSPTVFGPVFTMVLALFPVDRLGPATLFGLLFFAFLWMLWAACEPFVNRALQIEPDVQPDGGMSRGAQWLSAVGPTLLIMLVFSSRRPLLLGAWAVVLIALALAPRIKQRISRRKP
jgi:hypothetical protein